MSVCLGRSCVSDSRPPVTMCNGLTLTDVGRWCLGHPNMWSSVLYGSIEDSSRPRLAGWQAGRRSVGRHGRLNHMTNDKATGLQFVLKLQAGGSQEDRQRITNSLTYIHTRLYYLYNTQLHTSRNWSTNWGFVPSHHLFLSVWIPNIYLLIPTLCSSVVSLKRRERFTSHQG